MSLSDCAMCWNTPCTCGHGYREWSAEKLRLQIAMLQGVLEKKAGVIGPPKAPLAEMERKAP